MRKRPEARNLTTKGKSLKGFQLTNGMIQDIRNYSDQYKEYETDFVEHALNHYMAVRIDYEDELENRGIEMGTFEEYLETLIK